MKLVGIDLDGTLLNKDLIIQKVDIKAIQEAQKNNINVVIVSGRGYFDAKHILEKHGLNNCPVIGSNGAEIVINDKHIVQEFLPNTLTTFLIEYLNSHQYYYQVYRLNDILVSNLGITYLQKELEECKEIDPLGFLESIKAQTNQFRLQMRQGKIYPTDVDKANKFIIISPCKSKRLRLKTLIETIKQLTITSSGQYNLEIIPSNINKGRAIKTLCDYLSIKLDDCFVIGDNMNDVSMFNVIKNSIAMGNADKRLKAISKFETLTNDNCGVSYAFEHFITSVDKKNIII